MAQKVLVSLVDDLDGSTTENVRTVEFALDGASYQIDLSDENADRLRESLQVFVGCARRTGGRLRKPPASASSASQPSGRTKEQVAEMREWLRANGHDVSDRGRIAKALVARFEEAHAPKTETPKPPTRSRKKKPAPTAAPVAFAAV